MTEQLTTKRIADWLKPQLSSGIQVVSGRLPEVPNRVVGIQMVPSPGLEMDGLFDAINFQATSRGGENNLDDAESIALQVDNIMTGRGSNGPLSTENLLIKKNVADTGIYVSQMGRLAGRPTQLDIPDPVSRFTFTCVYFMQVATDIGMVFNG